MKWVFWVSLAVLVYTYAGYPAWLWVRGRFRQRALRTSQWYPPLSIIMVVRNEAEVLESKLQNLMSLDYPPQLCEIIVVSDGSTDETDDILCRYRDNPIMRIVSRTQPSGKAAGLNDAIAIANGELVLFTDARQKIEAGALQLLVKCFADPEVGCASGELMLGDPDSGEAVRGMGLYWRIEKTIREMESASGSVVGATGALYVVKRRLLPQLPEGTILDDVYIPMHVARQGFRVIFVPSARAWDVVDRGTEHEFSRKVRTLGGNYQLVQLAPWLLSSANPLRFEFISHKLMRLFAPFALALVFVASLLLAGHGFYRAVLVLQIAFYMLSLLAMVKLPKSRLARLADAAWTFVILNSAALVAFVKFVTGRRVAWVR